MKNIFLVHDELLKIVEIKSSQEYLDKAIKAAKKDAYNAARQVKDKNKLVRVKHRAKVSAITSVLKDELTKILKSFPRIDSLPEFYKKLIELKYSIKDIKQALAHINWTLAKLDEFKTRYKNKVERYKEFLGRISSLIKDLDKDFEFLNEIRRYFKKFPIIKETPTLALIGLPNVGKSTFLKTFTKANPEIKNYAFTTKKLQIGYTELQMQIVDCPGMLNRAFENMNWIEKQAYLAIKYLAKDFFFILDPTQDIDEQVKLLKRVLRLIDKCYILINKIDLICENKECKKLEELKNDILNKLKIDEKKKIVKVIYVSLLNQENIEIIKEELEKIYFKQLRELKSKNLNKNTDSTH